MIHWMPLVFMGSVDVGSIGDWSLCFEGDQFRRRRRPLLREPRPALAPVHRRAGRMGVGFRWDLHYPQGHRLDDGTEGHQRRRTARAGFEPARRKGLFVRLTGWTIRSILPGPVDDKGGVRQ